MRALQAGRPICQGVLELSRAAALESSSKAPEQQWSAVFRWCAAAFSTNSAPGWISQACAAQQHLRSSSFSYSSSSSRCFASFARLQQQQQQALPRPLLCQPVLSLSLQQQLQQQPQQQQPQLGGMRTFVLMPRRIKYRKAHKSMGFNENICPNTRTLGFGLYGIRAMEHCRIPARTIEAARRTLRRHIKKTAMLWIRITPNVPVTSKPAEVRMGKGKGSLDYWAAPIRPGQILFEMDRCSRTDALAALRSIQAKMPIKVGFVEWN